MWQGTVGDGCLLGTGQMIKPKPFYTALKQAASKVSWMPRLTLPALRLSLPQQIVPEQ